MTNGRFPTTAERLLSRRAWLCPPGSLPSYSSHGIGVQSNFILPKKDLVAFFKYYDAYKALASVKGRTFVFGFSWTLKIPKTQAP